MIKQYQGYISIAALVFASIAGISIYTALPYTFDWRHVEQKAYSAVVQVFAQHAEFNWLEPYKAPQQCEGTGTAFFIDQEGHLLTNFHVINQAKSLHLCIPGFGKKTFDATIVGTCPESDVALLKLSEEGMREFLHVVGKIPYLRLGNSDSCYPTQEVLALGYPLGERNITSTKGEVANCVFVGGRSYMHITAAVNPGNSGGPLINKEGEVIGINSAFMPYVPNSEKLPAQSIAYAIPVKQVKNLLNDLYTIKLIRKPLLGASFNNTTPEHARSLGNPLPGGYYVNEVYKGSIADKIGMKVGDMLYQINGFNVDQFGDVDGIRQKPHRISLEEFLISLPIKAPLGLVVYRNGKELTLKGSYEEARAQSVRYIYPDYESEVIDYEMFGGLCVQQLRENHFKYLPHTLMLQEYMKAENQYNDALVITRILPGSYIHKINCFYEGAILDMLNGVPVRTLQDVRKALEESAKTGEIAIKTKDKIYTVISLDAVLQDEKRIARDFMFTVTETMEKLIKIRTKYASGSGE
jgi:serine protease Do